MKANARALPMKREWHVCNRVSTVSFQLSKYLDVQDFPILGFVAPSVVTVLHAHVWQSAVDYRPIHLPLRVLLTLDSFSVSSNLAIESSVSLLR